MTKMCIDKDKLVEEIENIPDIKKSMYPIIKYILEKVMDCLVPCEDEKTVPVERPSTGDRSLKEIIEELKFGYVNSNITEQNFPKEKIRGEVVIEHFDKYIKLDEVIDELAKEGLEPANIYELLEYAKNDWNGIDLIVAPGSVWGGHVPYLAYWYDRRRLDLSGRRGRWDRDFRFAAIKLDTTVSTPQSELGNLGDMSAQGWDKIENIIQENARLKKMVEDLKKQLYEK